MRRGDVILLNADAGRIPLPDGVVHCSVTSPPYFSLRRYAGDQGRAWPAVTYAPLAGLPPVTIPEMTCPLGLEPTVEAYVGHLVAVYREVRRVLRDDGIAWIVISSSFASSDYEEELYQLREDLTREEIGYVLSELAIFQNKAANENV